MAETIWTPNDSVPASLSQQFAAPAAESTAVYWGGPASMVFDAAAQGAVIQASAAPAAHGSVASPITTVYRRVTTSVAASGSDTLAGSVTRRVQTAPAATSSETITASVTRRVTAAPAASATDSLSSTAIRDVTAAPAATSAAQSTASATQHATAAPTAGSSASIAGSVRQPGSGSISAATAATSAATRTLTSSADTSTGSQATLQQTMVKRASAAASTGSTGTADATAGDAGPQVFAGEASVVADATVDANASVILSDVIVVPEPPATSGGYDPSFLKPLRRARAKRIPTGMQYPGAAKVKAHSEVRAAAFVTRGIESIFVQMQVSSQIRQFALTRSAQPRPMRQGIGVSATAQSEDIDGLRVLLGLVGSAL